MVPRRLHLADRVLAGAARLSVASEAAMEAEEDQKEPVENSLVAASRKRRPCW